MWDYQVQDFRTVIVRTVRLRPNLLPPTEPEISQEVEELEKELLLQTEREDPIEKMLREEPTTD